MCYLGGAGSGGAEAGGRDRQEGGRVDVRGTGGLLAKLCLPNDAVPQELLRGIPLRLCC